MPHWLISLFSRLLKNAVWRRIFSMCAAATTGEMGSDPRGMRGNRYDIASYLILQTDSSRCGQKLRDANEIVSGCRQHEKPFHQRPPAMSGLASQPAHRLNPTEGLFDLFSFDRADAMTGVASSPRVDCRATVGIVLRHMRCAAALATADDEIRRVVVLVAAHGATWSSIVINHLEGSGALSSAVSFGQLRIDDERIAILHHQVPHMAQLCLLAGTFTKQPGIGVCGRAMRVILAFLAMEVALGIAPSARCRRVAAVLRHETLHAGPSLNQCAVDREVLARQQLADLRQVEDSGHELARNIAVEQPIPVLAEHGGVPYRVIGGEANKPAEQQVIVKLLHQLPLRPNRVERLQQQRSQQALRRDRRASFPRIKSAKGRRQLPQGLVNNLADRSQRMVCRYPRLQRNVAEKNFRSLIFAAHRSALSTGCLNARNH